MSTGDDAVTMLRAQLAGGTFPPDGVEDSEGNAQLWDEIGQSIADMPEGVMPEIPVDWTTTPKVAGDGDG